MLHIVATGRSAKFILKTLIDDERIDSIYCVGVRERAGHTFPRRPSVEFNKVVVHRTDICKLRLGLSEQDYDFLTTHADAILHVAAIRSLWDCYPGL